jgi:hypothetical protein
MPELKESVSMPETKSQKFFVDGLYSVEFRPTDNLHDAAPYTRVQIGRGVETSDPNTAQRLHDASTAALQRVWNMIAEVRDQFADTPEGQTVSKLEELLRQAQGVLQSRRSQLAEMEARIESAAFDGSLSLAQQAQVAPMQSAATQAQTNVDAIQEHLKAARSKYLALVKDGVDRVRRGVLADCLARRIPAQESMAKLILENSVEQAEITAIETRFGGFWKPDTDPFANN